MIDTQWESKRDIEWRIKRRIRRQVLERQSRYIITCSHDNSVKQILTKMKELQGEKV